MSALPLGEVRMWKRYIPLEQRTYIRLIIYTVESPSSMFYSSVSLCYKHSNICVSLKFMLLWEDLLRRLLPQLPLISQLFSSSGIPCVVQKVSAIAPVQMDSRHEWKWGPKMAQECYEQKAIIVTCNPHHARISQKQTSSGFTFLKYVKQTCVFPSYCFHHYVCDLSTAYL